jgi:sensor histidine kinase regulating citrate/malate metabolism
MNNFEAFNKIKEEYEKELASFGEATILVDKENKIIFLSQETKSLLLDEGAESLLIGKKLTSVIKATTSQGTSGVPIDENTRPSLEATMVAETVTQIYYLSPINSPEKILVSSTATPIILSGEVAGAIIIFKKM